MPKASRTKLRQHAPAAQLPSKRSFAVDEPQEVLMPGSKAVEQAISSPFDNAAPGPSRKKGLVIPASAIPPALASHPYSRSHNRREKRKVKQNLHGGTLDVVAEALLQAVGAESADEEEAEQVANRGKGDKGQIKEKHKRKEGGGEGLIGEGNGRTMREKARRKQIKIEGMRIPAILKHPEYKKDPWATIRLHASNTLESSPGLVRGAQDKPKVAGRLNDMQGIDECEFNVKLSNRPASGDVRCETVRGRKADERNQEPTINQLLCQLGIL